MAQQEKNSNLFSIRERNIMPVSNTHLKAPNEGFIHKPGGNINADPQLRSVSDISLENLCHVVWHLLLLYR